MRRNNECVQMKQPQLKVAPLLTVPKADTQNKLTKFLSKKSSMLVKFTLG